ncbi:MAG: hypothetical protein ACE5KT_03815 [Methanosarcinales archaeon]
MDINKGIWLESLRTKEIEYKGYDDFPIRYDKIDGLINNTPERDIIDIGAYYLKNIILLQPFANANHRTALSAVKLFFRKNGYDFIYTVDKTLELQKRIYELRLKIYGTYEELPLNYFIYAKDS